MATALLLQSSEKRRDRNSSFVESLLRVSKLSPVTTFGGFYIAIPCLPSNLGVAQHRPVWCDFGSITQNRVLDVLGFD